MRFDKPKPDHTILHFLLPDLSSASGDRDVDGEYSLTASLAYNISSSSSVYPVYTKVAAVDQPSISNPRTTYVLGYFIGNPAKQRDRDCPKGCWMIGGCV